jgi:hypothetical protein
MILQEADVLLYDLDPDFIHKLGHLFSKIKEIIW